MRVLAWLIPAIAAFLIYMPSVTKALIWDDEIVQTRQINAFHSLRDVFFAPRGIHEWSNVYYRPVIVLTYLLDRALFGVNYQYHHLSNILYHAIATLFVALLARMVLRGAEWREWGAMAAGLLFAVHPVHVESVSMIMGRSDVVAAALMLPAIAAALHYRDHPRAIWALIAAPLLYLAALLSKEVALSTLLLLPCLLTLTPRIRDGAQSGIGKDVPSRPSDRGSGRMERHRRGRNASIARAPSPTTADGASAATSPSSRLRRATGRASLFRGTIGWAPFALMIPATGVWLLLRSMNKLQSGSALPGDVEPVSRFIRALAYYVRMSLMPWPQAAFVTPEMLPPLWPAALLLTVGAAALTAGVVLHRRGRPGLLLACAAFVLTLAPSLAIALRRISESPVAERYLYLPIAGVGLLLAAAICATPARRRSSPFIALALAAVPIAACAGLTLQRQAIYRDNIAFWTDTAAKAPQAGLPIYFLGLAYRDAGRDDEALPALMRSLELYDDREGRGLAYNAIGAIQLARGDYAVAERAFADSIRERPQYATAWHNLGLLYSMQAAAESKFEPIATLQRARDCFARAVQLSDNYTKARYAWLDALYRMGIALAQNGRLAEARSHLDAARQQAVEIARREPGGHFGEAATRALRDIDAALAQLPP